jgi:hypothetical protein
MSGADDGGKASVGSGGSRDRAPARRTNQARDLHCYNCGSLEHWADECPELSLEQQAQLHMAVEGNEEQEEVKEGHQLLNGILMQGTVLPENKAYLDGCSTVTAFKSDKYLKNVRTVQQGIKINCNARAVTTHQKGTYGKLNVRYLPNEIANIFSMHKLEQQYRITCDSWEGYYSVHMPRGVVKFHKDEQGLPYIDLDVSSQEAATMLMQVIQTQGAQECAEEGTMHVQTVRGNFEGYTKCKIIQAKEARKAQAMIGNPSKKDFKGLVSNHLVSKCPITYADITNAHQIFGSNLASIRGEMVHRTPEPVVADYVAVPQSLMECIK